MTVKLHPGCIGDTDNYIQVARALHQQQAQQPDGRCRVEIDTEQARRTVLLEPYQEGKAQCIIISGVAQGSQAWDAGVRPGQRLVGISDPNNNDQVWELNASTSLRFVRDALRFRIAASIRFDVDTDVIVPAAAPEAAASDGDQDVALKRAPSLSLIHI